MASRVLLYHAIGPVPPDGGEGMFTPPEVLEAHVTRLLDLGFRFLTAGELADEWRPGSDPPDNVAVLTFDDGWRDGLTTVAPLLAGLGVRATFYLCPDGFGRPHRLTGPEPAVLTAREALALHDAGMELGSHTMGHHNVLELGDDDLRWEFEASREYLQALTGAPCRTLAYPSGRHDPRVEQAARDAGYELAFACVRGPWKRHAVPRWHMPPTADPERLRWKLDLEALIPGG